MFLLYHRAYIVFSGVKNSTIVGKTIIEAYGGTKESQFPTTFTRVATTGVEHDLGEIVYGDDKVKTVRAIITISFFIILLTYIALERFQDESISFT